MRLRGVSPGKQRHFWVGHARQIDHVRVARGAHPAHVERRDPRDRRASTGRASRISCARSAPTFRADGPSPIASKQRAAERKRQACNCQGEPRLLGQVRRRQAPLRAAPARPSDTAPSNRPRTGRAPRHARTAPRTSGQAARGRRRNSRGVASSSQGRPRERKRAQRVAQAVRKIRGLGVERERHRAAEVVQPQQRDEQRRQHGGSREQRQRGRKLSRRDEARRPSTSSQANGSSSGRSAAATPSASAPPTPPSKPSVVSKRHESGFHAGHGPRCERRAAQDDRQRREAQAAHAHTRDQPTEHGGRCQPRAESEPLGRHEGPRARRLRPNSASSCA